MSYIERARQNKVMAEKAAAYDQLEQRRREQDVYSRGTNDAYSAVEQELLRRTQGQGGAYNAPPQGLASSLLP